MIIPEDKYFSDQADKAWEHAAAQIGIEYGIMVEIGRDRKTIIETFTMPGGAPPMTMSNVKTSRIFFKLNGHEFETLTDLKRALQLKAFL